MCTPDCSLRELPASSPDGSLIAGCCAGVCVLAATSRPDLLDAALLRPGRLDRLIYCGFPSPAERGHILHALARRLRLDAAVALDAVGAQCEGYSGADLSALLSEAQLAAVHERLDLASKQATTAEVGTQYRKPPFMSQYLKMQNIASDTECTHQASAVLHLHMK